MHVEYVYQTYSATKYSPEYFVIFCKKFCCELANASELANARTLGKNFVVDKLTEHQTVSSDVSMPSVSEL